MPKNFPLANTSPRYGEANERFGTARTNAKQPGWPGRSGRPLHVTQYTRDLIVVLRGCACRRLLVRAAGGALAGPLSGSGPSGTRPSLHYHCCCFWRLFLLYFM